MNRFAVANLQKVTISKLCLITKQQIRHLSDMRESLCDAAQVQVVKRAIISLQIFDFNISIYCYF